MPILLSTLNAWLIFGGVFLGILLILFIILLITCGFRSKRNSNKNVDKVLVDEEFINKLLNGLGELDNILSAAIDNGRVKFEVKDLELLKTDDLKELSQRGVFISGKNVKLLFKYDSTTILSALKQRGVN